MSKTFLTLCSTSFSSLPCSLPTSWLLSAKQLHAQLNFVQFSFANSLYACLPAIGYRKKLPIENADLVTFFRYIINSGNGTVNILPTVASIQRGPGDVMRYMEVLAANLTCCFRQIFPTGTPQTQKTIVSQQLRQKVQTVSQK